MTAKCLFLDRDGVINADFGFVSRFEDIKFIDGIFELCQVAVAEGFKIIIVTNQSGIERGLFTQHQFVELMEQVTRTFAARGCPIDDYLFSPHMPRNLGGGKLPGLERKPNPEMIRVASERHGIALSDSLLIGDKESDIEAGRAAGVGKLVWLKSDSATADEAIQQGDARVISSLKDFNHEWLSSDGVW